MTVEYLKNIVLQHGKIIAAVDFDDTVYPYHANTKDTCTRVINTLKSVVDYLDIYIYTCRPESDYPFIYQYLKEVGLPFIGINCDTVVKNKKKMYANLYIDNKAGLSDVMNALRWFRRDLDNGLIPEITGYKPLHDEVVDWIKDFFNENGPDCKAVVGISGGKDSSVVAALCVEALGKDRVFGVLMPQGEQADIEDSKKLVQFLGINYIVANINGAYQSLKNEIKVGLNDHWSKQSSFNLPPRLRMATLYAVAQTINGRVANTSNLSESYIGWSTRWGDSVGDFAPLRYLTTDEVVEIGRVCGLPEELLIKAPADGLTGNTDEENFGFTYEQLNNYIKNHTSGDLQIDEKIEQMHKKSEFKRRDIPSYQNESQIWF